MKNLDAYQNADSKTGTEREIAGIARAAVFELRAKTDKRLETRKIKDCLNRDYCINISRGRVYRLMKTMNLPKMSTVKPPKTPKIKTDDSNCINLLAESFNQPAPNMVWVCDFFYNRQA